MAKAALNREEAELDLSICQLHDSIKDEIFSINSDSPDAENPRKFQAKIQSDMTQLRARMRELELLADEQETVEEGEAVVAVVNSHKRRYQALQKDFREANLEVQRVAARKVMEERKALLGSANPLQRVQQLKTQADLANSATDTTASLQRTRQLMAEELDHTSATLAALEVSSTTLKGAADEYGQQRGRIKKSHKLLGTMRRASVWDRITLWGGAAIFFAVVAFIVYKRLAFFVPAALVPNLGALMPAMPAFSLANLTSGLAFWSPPPGPPPGSPPRLEVDVDNITTGGGLPDTDAGMEQWQRWAAAPGQQRVAEDAASARGREGVDRGLADVEGVYKEGGSADEWPDPSDPAYVEPAVRYAEQLSAAEARPAEAAATAHPGYAGFGGMQASAMVANVATQNGSTTGTMEEVQPAETLHINASQLADVVHANMTDEAPTAEQQAAAAHEEAATEDVLEEEAIPLPVDFNVTEDTLPSDIEQPGLEELPNDSPLEDADLPSEAADREEEATEDSSADAAAADASTGRESAGAIEQQDEGLEDGGEELQDSLEGLPQDILGGAEQEAEIAHRHAAPHFAKEASMPIARDSADLTDEPAAEAASEGSALQQALDEERADLADILAATPGLETVTVPVSNDTAEEVPFDIKELADPNEIATGEMNESQAELSASAGEEAALRPSAEEDSEQEMEATKQEDDAEEEAHVTGKDGGLEEGVSGTEEQEDMAEAGGAAEEPLVESRDGLDAGMLYQRLSKEGHEAAQRSSSAEEGGAGSDVPVDTGVPVDHELPGSVEAKEGEMPDREL